MKNNLRIYQCIWIIGLLFCTTIKAQVSTDPNKVWSEIIELEQGLLSRHILNDIPGTIVALIPQSDGTYKPRLLGRKTLKAGGELPKLESIPTLLIEDLASKEVALSVSYLSMISASMEDTEEVRFSVTETSHTSILDNDIDWDSFDERVAGYLTQIDRYPEGTIFGVVKVASVIVVDHQKFVKKKRAADINGWGLSANGKYLSESSKRNVTFKVGVSLTYSDLQLDSYVSRYEELKSYTDWQSTHKYENKLSLIKLINEEHKSNIVSPITETIDYQ